MSSLGSRIKSLRTEHKMTQDQIAKQLGMGRSNFGHIENDRVIPSSDDLQKIADILQTTSDYLLGRVEAKATTPTQAAPDWATAKDKRDLAKFINDPQGLFYKGVEFDETDKAKMIGVLEAIFWDAKARNKAAYKKSREKKKQQ